MSHKLSRTVGLYVLEEQDIYKDIYHGIFANTGFIELLGISRYTDTVNMRQTVTNTNPDVIYVSVKRLDRNLVDELKHLRVENPRLGIVLVFLLYSAENIRLMRKLAANTEAGMALLLKQSLGAAEQLHSVIRSVNDGQVTLDPALTGLMFSEGREHPFLEGLTAREIEIMDLLAKGNTNSAIAEMLFIDIRTVHHHINNLYSKLKADPHFNTKNPRVSAARIYLETTGELLSTAIPD